MKDFAPVGRNLSNLHGQLKLSLHHLLPYSLSANAHVSWRRVLRTPPHLPFLGRGVPQVLHACSLQMADWAVQGLCESFGGNQVDGLPPALVTCRAFFLALE